MFALKYPDQVGGMVLVDATGESADSLPASATSQNLPQVTGSEWSLYGILRRVGLVRLIGARQWGPQTLSEQTRTELALFATGQRGLDATAAEYVGMAADNAQLQAAPSLGDKPLIVLAADESMETNPRWPEYQHWQAAMSTNGRLIVVESSSHYIQLDHPEVVIDAVQQVVEQGRGH
jgi:pimeloyl-ACP methyl ester carboxylesterase